ncbi:MAG: hypothetical protein ABI200_03230, partial [Gaiellales bacterium]
RTAELGRYDAVVFMHTAARLPAGYERDLDVRTEDRDEAVDLDRRIFELYADHPQLVAIESSASFLDKLTLVRNAIAALLHPERAVAEPEPQYDAIRRTLRPEQSADARDVTFPRPMRGMGGSRATLQPAPGSVTAPAPVASLMGLSSTSHVLPVD